MLNILAISETGEGYGLARILVKERNFVKFYTASETGRGVKLPKKIDNIEETNENPDITICCQNTDSISRGATGMADLGKFIIGSSGLYSNFLNERFLSMFYSLINNPIITSDDYNCEVWGMFNGEVWLPFYVINSLGLRINGKRGARYTSTGNCVEVVEEFKYKNIFEDLTSFLKKNGFVGFIGLKFLNQDFVGVCTTLNLGMFYALREVLLVPFTELLLALISGDIYKPKCKAGFGISVMLSTPPFPFIYSNLVELDKVLDINEDVLKHFIFEDLVEQDGIQYTGTFGLIGWSTAFGSTVREAKRRVYRTINNIVKTPFIQYDLNVGDEADMCFKEFKEVYNATIEGKVEESTINEYRNAG
jgi:hypothetical protein